MGVIFKRRARQNACLSKTNQLLVQQLRKEASLSRRSSHVDKIGEIESKGRGKKFVTKNT